METNRKEILCSFTAIDSDHNLQKIIVSQEIRLHYSGTTTHKKHFFLETMNGPEVYKTADPDIFKLIDGTTFRKKTR